MNPIQNTSDVDNTSDIDNYTIAKRLILESIPPRWKTYVLSLILMAGVATFTAALAWSTKLIVNEVFVAGSLTKAWSVAALVVGVSAALSLCQYGNDVIAKVLNRSISSMYQRKLFNSLIDKDLSFFASGHPASTMQQVFMSGRMGASVVVKLCNGMLTDLLTLVGLVAVMVVQDPVMSVTAIIMFPLIFLLITTLSKKIKAIAKSEATLLGKVHSVGVEAFQGIKTVKSYQLEPGTKGRFSEAVQALEDRILNIARITAATMPFMQMLGGLVLGLYVLYASWQTVANGKTPGEFTAFISAFLLAYQPAERVSKGLVDIQNAIVLSDYMFKMIEIPVKLRATGTETLEGRPASLDFDNVSFSYEGRIPALNNVSFHLDAGQNVAIVGRSGAGKTTLIDLVQRFYDPTHGAVKIGGEDLRSLSHDALRNSTALISQEVFLFEGTIRQNILDGRRDATEEEIMEVVREAQLAEVIAEMPMGLDTQVGANGNALSGGQKQRVGIARALLKDAKIIIFDEATSALDGESEREILGRVVASNPDKTLLFVSHRPAILQWVDKVMLMDGGHLMAMDSHENLMATNPIYRSLFNLQAEEGAEVGSEAADGTIG
ncbi:ABC transporter ATP-binding protein [Aliiruegeria sabulilitoris]|uniref:ABC transporter ATP-binding protein n=1 Tax=Aliiruegeria sabulilitoris TaxID=1510458 RepID=UPI0008327CE7|nr:ABC transporter ATP-binding protein [Aliiruegeria sabulilitoris]NDR55559.1 ABC transporter ATP-binding protein [Pseudoruegeria sp. M32A2M]